MPLNEGSSFWGSKQYQELSQLPLPGPAVVIDIRRGSDHDPPLIWNLGVELEDLGAEMWLNQVYRWRHLNNCVDLLKLAPLDERGSVRETSDFILTTRDGQTRTLQGARALIGELGREHLDRVRNNRIGAARDRGKESGGIYLEATSPEQTTVRVFFLVDAEDFDSLVSAASYAEWLRRWYHEYEQPGRSGRDRRVSTLAVCLNANPHVHHPLELARYLNRVSGDRPALDALILLHTYGDDESFIGGDIQAYQVELILYALLLLSPDSLTIVDGELSSDLSLSPYVLSEEEMQSATAPWPIFMIGISSLEYSARWGGRWLDYKLVAKIIGIMQDSTEVDREDQLGHLRHKVREKFQQWRQAVNELVPDALTATVQELSVLDEVQLYLATSPFKGKEVTRTKQELNAFSQHICQLYVGERNTLANAMESASLVPWLLKRDYLRGAKNEDDAASPTSSLYEKILSLQSQAAQLPASLFDGAYGLLPRTLRQVSELSAMIEEIQQVAIHPPDMKECRKQFRQQVEQEQRKLEEALNARKWLSGNRKIRLLREESLHRLRTLIQGHIEQVREVIRARIVLAVLEEAGLYNPTGNACLYQQRLKRFHKLMRDAQVKATLQHNLAYERLQSSLSETQVGITQAPTWLSLNNRRDLLDWEQVLESFEGLYKHLEATPISLNLLMEWLLRLFGGEKPSLIIQQYWQQIKEKSQMINAAELEKMRLQTLSTMLVAVLLLLDVVDFDITTLQQLLTQYIDMRERFGEAPSFLENNILGLQRILREAKATHSDLRNGKQKLPTPDLMLRQEQPPELILAAWVNNQCADDPLLIEALDRSGILAHLVENKINPAQAIDDLRERNKLLGYRDDMAGEDRFYLLLAPGEGSQAFLKEVAMLYPTEIHPLLFPDGEKLIYLHIHNVRYMAPGPTLPSQKLLSPM